MPVYNAADYIHDAISSVLVQTFPSFELLIVNDGSTDDTEKVINSFHDDRIRLIRQEQKGVAAALNYGIMQARGEFIARFDADDICYPERLEIQYSFMRTHPEFIIIGSAVDYIDANKQFIFSYYPPALTNQEIQQLPYSICPFIHSSVFYRKDVISEIGYNEYAYGFEDHLLWLSAIRLGKVHNLPQPLVKVRLNPDSVTIDERKRSRKFLTLKYNALKNEAISQIEGLQLLNELRDQDTRRIKENAYYSLLAKKYLWNNHNPSKARENIRKAIARNLFDIKGYGLFILSYLPVNFIVKLHRRLSSSR